MKVAPVYRAFQSVPNVNPALIHTGQHFDPEMSDEFIKALELPTPDVHLGVGSGSPTWQMATIMQRLEGALEEYQPDAVVVVGDVSSTLAAALAADCGRVPVAHVEAGLRSHNWAMPEERNRVLTDRLSRWLFTPSRDADENLLREGLPNDRIYFVGNVMIDSLDWILPRLTSEVFDRYRLPDEFGLVTLHRAGNVDSPETLRGLIDALVEISADLPLVFPVHPRTQQRLSENDIDLGHTNVRALGPLGYPDFVALLSRARLVLTDSGGIQEEAVVLGVPCLTLRSETERPITLAGGMNEVVGTEPRLIVAAARQRLVMKTASRHRPELWDGRAGERIVSILTG